MRFLYRIGIAIVRFTYFIASFFDAKAHAFVQGRKYFFKRFKDAFATESAPLIWIHCASLSEFEQGRPVLEKVKSEFPNNKVLLTFFSPSGYEAQKNYPLADHVFYLPWDTPQHAYRFIETCKPVLAIFVKYEFWIHYTRELKKRGIPTLSVSAKFRSDQLFFKSYGGFYRSVLKNFSWFFVQNDESVKLLKSIGIEQVTRAGDTRFDRVNQLLKQTEPIAIAENFKGTQKVMVIGSCWPEDLEVLIPFINENYFHLKFIIAPHEINDDFIIEMEGAMNAHAVRYSQSIGNLEDYHVLIVDRVGMLGRLYRYGEFAYVGGAFGKGLHNILEAACYGIPVFFGNKNFQQFQEAVDLINRGGAFEIADYRDMKAKYEMINVPQNFLLACEVTRQYVEENLGATEKIMQYCRPILSRA